MKTITIAKGKNSKTKKEENTANFKGNDNVEARHSTLDVLNLQVVKPLTHLGPDGEDCKLKHYSEGENLFKD